MQKLTSRCFFFFFFFFFFFSGRAESRQFLLYARQIEIRGVDLDNPYYNYIISFTVPDIDNVTVVDYDAMEQRIYWSDVRTQTIKRAFINGTGVETVVSAGEEYNILVHSSSASARFIHSCDSVMGEWVNTLQLYVFVCNIAYIYVCCTASLQLLNVVSRCGAQSSDVVFFICMHFFFQTRPAQCPGPGSGLGVQEPVLDELRRQQEADQCGPAGRLLQERRHPRP